METSSLFQSYKQRPPLRNASEIKKIAQEILLNLRGCYIFLCFLPFLILFQIRAVIGHSYMLSQDEELWEKYLPDHVEDLLTAGRDPLLDRSKDSADKGVALPRDKTRAVSYRVPHNASVQVYDYKERKSR